MVDKGQPFAETGKEEFNKILNKIVAPKLIQLIDSLSPQVVVCTHPFPLGILDKLKERGSFSAGIVATLTDFTVHPFWVFSRVDSFTVASQKLQLPFEEYDIDLSKVHPVGIPIKTCFSDPVDRAEVRRRLALRKNLPTVLLIGGGLGMGPLPDIVKALQNCSSPLQIIAVTGNNNSLKSKLERLAPNLKNPMRVLGFVNNIHELMAVADLMVGKAGGLCCAEAMAKGLPIIIVDPLPGQEVKNAEFLSSQGAAVRVGGVKYLAQKVDECLRSPWFLQGMVEAAKSLGKPNAARDTAELILSRC